MEEEEKLKAEFGNDEDAEGFDEELVSDDENDEEYDEEEDHDFESSNNLAQHIQPKPSLCNTQHVDKLPSSTDQKLDEDNADLENQIQSLSINTHSHTITSDTAPNLSCPHAKETLPLTPPPETTLTDIDNQPGEHEQDDTEVPKNEQEGSDEENIEGEEDLEFINNKSYRPFRDFKPNMGPRGTSPTPSTRSTTSTLSSRFSEAEIRERVVKGLKKNGRIPGRTRNSVKASSRRDARDAVKRSTNFDF